MAGMFGRDASGVEKAGSGVFNQNISTKKWLIARADGGYPLSYTRWDTSNVTDMSKMFVLCKGFENGGEPNLNWNTSKVTKMESMFSDVPYLSKLDISEKEVTIKNEVKNDTAGQPPVTVATTYKAWDTSKVTDMSKEMTDRIAELKK